MKKQHFPRMRDAIVNADSFESGALALDFPIVVIHKNPFGYPVKYAARLWDGEVQTNYLMLSDTLEALIVNMPEWMIQTVSEGIENTNIVAVFVKRIPDFLKEALQNESDRTKAHDHSSQTAEG